MSYVEYPYKRMSPKNVNNADAIVVLSGMRELNNKNTKIFEWNDADRFFAGLKLYSEGKSKNLIFTGGYSPFFNNNITEGEINKTDAINLGIPSSSIFISKKAYNTYQEAKVIKDLISNNPTINGKEIILVTSAFHMKRAKFLFESFGMEVIEFPVDFKSGYLQGNFFYNPYYWFPNSGSLHISSIALREIMGRLFYKVK